MIKEKKKFISLFLLSVILYLSYQLAGYSIQRMKLAELINEDYLVVTIDEVEVKGDDKLNFISLLKRQVRSGGGFQKGDPNIGSKVVNIYSAQKGEFTFYINDLLLENKIIIIYGTQNPNKDLFHTYGFSVSERFEAQ